MPSLSRRVSVALRGTDLGWRYLYNAAPSFAFKPGALSAEQARIVKLLVERVDLTADAAAIRIRTAGIEGIVSSLRQKP